MIYSFQDGVTYHTTDKVDAYLKVISSFQFSDGFYIWGVWYTKDGDCRISEHKDIQVKKDELNRWHYGKYGPC